MCFIHIVYNTCHKQIIFTTAWPTVMYKDGIQNQEYILLHVVHLDCFAWDFRLVSNIMKLDGSVNLLMDEMLVLVMGRDVNIDAVVLGLAVLLASLVSSPLIPELMHTSFCSLKRAVGVILGLSWVTGLRFLKLVLSLREGRPFYSWYFQNSAHTKTIQMDKRKTMNFRFWGDLSL